MSAEVIKLADRRKLKHPEADLLVLPFLMVALYVDITLALIHAIYVAARR
jgi:hypothetical protein